MFDLMERLSEVDLGTPGPLVHTLERWAPTNAHPAPNSRRRFVGNVSADSRSSDRGIIAAAKGRRGTREPPHAPVIAPAGAWRSSPSNNKATPAF
jgi:hypothetical protein